MTSEEFFSNQSDNWDFLVGEALTIGGVSISDANGKTVVCGECKWHDAHPKEASRLLSENQLFSISNHTKCADGFTGLGVIDRLVADFSCREPIAFSFRLFDEKGWEHVYSADVIAIETDDSSEENALDPKQLVFLVGEWEVVSTRGPETKDDLKAEKEFDECEPEEDDEEPCDERCKCRDEEKETDLDIFAIYLSDIKSKAMVKAFGKDGSGSFSCSFSQVTDKDGKTTTRHSINGSEEEVNEFDKDGNWTGGSGDKCKCQHQCTCHCDDPK